MVVPQGGDWMKRKTVAIVLALMVTASVLTVGIGIVTVEPDTVSKNKSLESAHRPHSLFLSSLIAISR